jgi:Reverse transcriptase (RNA-dependent DNA polymerase)
MQIQCAFIGTLFFACCSHHYMIWCMPIIKDLKHLLGVQYDMSDQACRHGRAPGPIKSQTGSIDYVIISKLKIITHMHLSSTVISLDFSKAFDTIWHFTLLEKMAQLDLPVNVYNWLVDFFSGRTHCTVYHGKTSTLKSITASIIQGSGIGAASYVISAGNLRVPTPGNKLCKFADETYLIIPEINVDSRSAEIDQIWTWARTNSSTLNQKKSTEIIFVDMRR